MQRIAARHASEWNAWGLEDLAGRRQGLLEACERAGRDPATMRTSVNALVDLGGRNPSPGRAVVSGTAQQVTDQLGRYADLGFDEFILPDWNLGDGYAQLSDNLARIKTEVFDQLAA